MRMPSAGFLTMTWLQISISELINQSICFDSRQIVLNFCWVHWIRCTMKSNKNSVLYAYSFARIACLPTLEESWKANTHRSVALTWTCVIEVLTHMRIAICNRIICEATNRPTHAQTLACVWGKGVEKIESVRSWDSHKYDVLQWLWRRWRWRWWWWWW